MSDDAPPTKKPSELEHARERGELRESHPEGVSRPDLHDARYDFDRRMERIVERAVAPIGKQISEIGKGIQADRRRARSAGWLARANLGALLLVCIGVFVVWRGQIDTGRQIEELRRELGATRHDLERRLDVDAARIENLERRVTRIEKEIEEP